jgi:outer membrane scaffolding protein for murein synthesis (MipA/OmpV family)
LREVLVVLVNALGAAGALATGPDEPRPEVESGVSAGRLRPLWELGIGLTGLSLPDYRGSDQTHNYLLPLPYAVYRGRILKADRDGARALLFDAPRVKVDVSLAGTTPTRSNNEARTGMPDLLGVGEIGPNLSLTLLASPADHWKLDLRLPLRAAVTLQRAPQFIGTTFSPNLNFDLDGGGVGWNAGLLTGPLFADRKYHDHYYSVDSIYATPARPAYQARGGYAGWQALASASRRIGDFWFGAFLRYDTLRGAVFEDSPLVRRSTALTFGFGLAWVLSASTELVPSTD